MSETFQYDHTFKLPAFLQAHAEGMKSYKIGPGGLQALDSTFPLSSGMIIEYDNAKYLLNITSEGREQHEGLQHTMWTEYSLAHIPNLDQLRHAEGECQKLQQAFDTTMISCRSETWVSGYFEGRRIASSFRKKHSGHQAVATIDGECEGLLGRLAAALREHEI